ncbi:MAG TPA: alanine racemase [Edaphocola sp.]|nr:alanine racemase [Edaphocola sp.]
MRHTSEIILDKNALDFNIDFLEKEMGGHVLISYVVKGNAYGHGIGTYAPMAAATGRVRHFSVFSADEARRLLKYLPHPVPIMIMGYADNDELEWAIRSGVEFFVSDTGRLKKAIDLSEKLKTKARIHLELETGMNRTGIPEKALSKEVFPALKNHEEAFTLKGICTHFAGAENIANYIRIENQKKLFRKLLQQIKKQDLAPEYVHTCCSAAAIRFEDMRFNMVRIGILQYGLWPNQETKIEFLRKNNLPSYDLKRVLTWKTEIMAVKEVSMGDFIGYGVSYQAAHDMKIAIIPAGYSNGYSRVLSNSGGVIIHGVRAGIVGTVNMNVLMVDLTGVPPCKPGDSVTLIGEEGEAEISVSSFGELSNQLNYELLTRLPMDIPRRVL